MAKKKSKGGNKNAANVDNSNPNTPVLEAESSAALTAEASEAPSEPSTLEAAPSMEASQAEVSPLPAQGFGDVDVEELKRELEACRSQIAELKSQNAALSDENQRLKDEKAKAVPTQAPTAGAAPPGDLEALTQRIAKLKAEQAEADAAREAAWSQLKTVVADIARLAA
ncbi:hypothetical protein Agub_g805, partial [Astrephomene gubernaculifera]